MWVDIYVLDNAGEKPKREFYAIFAVGLNERTNRFYLIGQIMATSNRISLLGVVRI